MPTREWRADKRAAKLDAHEEQRPSDRRIINRNDWDRELSRRVSVLTLNAREDVKLRFIQLAVHPRIGICQTSEEAQAYFTRGGPPFTTEILRKFAHATAVSSDGYIQDRISAKSCEKTLVRLWAAAKAAGNPIQLEVKEAALFYVYGPLVTEGLVHTESKTKVTATPDDLTSFIKVLFSRRFADTIVSTREILLLALFVCLYVDCSSRSSELVMPLMPVKDIGKYKAQNPEKMFRWSNIEIYAFLNQKPRGGRITLYARLTFKGLKTNSPRDPLAKTIPLRLLPPELVAEDSLFWLVTLGLIDGVFAEISTWDDIDRLQPGENGLLLKIKPTAQQEPVFRGTNYRPGSGEDLVQKEQMMANRITDRLIKASRICGLKYAVLPNVLRRSSAYILAITVSPEERRARMGHGELTTTYWNSYRNTTSTVDVQARRHNIEEENVMIMSSIFLNTDANDPPPSHISAQGMAAILNDPELNTLMTEKSALLDRLLTEHGSLDAAQSKDPSRRIQYTVLRNKYSIKLATLQRKRYAEECKTWWAAKEGRQHTEIPEGHQVRSRIDQVLDESEEQEAQLPDNSAMPIDLQTLNEASAVASALVMDLDASDSKADSSLDDVQAAAAEEPTEISYTTASTSIVMRGRTFVPGEGDVPKHTLVDHLPSLLYDQPEDMTWKQLSDVCTTTFNHLHNAGRFFPNQEPLPGTWQCRFCGITFLGKKLGKTSPENHSFFCQAHSLAERVHQTLQSGDAAAVESCPLGGCWYSLKDTTSAKWKSHLSIKERHYWNDVEPEWTCSNHDTNLVFHSRYDLTIHSITAHAAPSKLVSLKSTSWEALLFFCHFCQILIPRTDELEEHHLQAHLDVGDVTATIVDHGLAGVERNLRWIHPGFCIFCVFNTRRSPIKRFNTLNSLSRLLDHVTSDHIERMTESIRCPAAGVSTPEGLPQCTDTAVFDAAGLSAHLEEVHGYRVHSRKRSQPGKKKRKSADAVMETSAAKEDLSAEGQENLDAVQEPAKKMNLGSRQPLRDLDVNQASQQL